MATRKDPLKAVRKESWPAIGQALRFEGRYCSSADMKIIKRQYINGDSEGYTGRPSLVHQLLRGVLKTEAQWQSMKDSMSEYELQTEKTYFHAMQKTFTISAKTVCLAGENQRFMISSLPMYSPSRYRKLKMGVSRAS